MLISHHNIALSRLSLYVASIHNIEAHATVTATDDALSETRLPLQRT